jgi:hypothetical protein
LRCSAIHSLLKLAEPFAERPVLHKEIADQGTERHGCQLIAGRGDCEPGKCTGNDGEQVHDVPSVGRSGIDRPDEMLMRRK